MIVGTTEINRPSYQLLNEHLFLLSSWWSTVKWVLRHSSMLFPLVRVIGQSIQVRHSFSAPLAFNFPVSCFLVQLIVVARTVSN